MVSLRVSLKFTQLAVGPLRGFAGGVVLKMTGNAAYVDPEVPLADIAAANTRLGEAEAAMGSGTQATAIRDQMREALLRLLKQQAYYVQNACNNDMGILLGSGFEAVSMNRAQSPLVSPVILQITNPMSGMLGLRLGSVPNARSYEVRYQDVPEGWTSGGIFPSTRTVIFGGLTPGVAYTVQVRAIGGSMGYSDWSDPQSHYSL